MLSQLRMVFSIKWLVWKDAEVEVFNLLEGIIPSQRDWGKTKFLAHVGFVVDRVALGQVLFE